MSLEPHGNGSLSEVYVLHEVSLLVAISSNHSLELELVQNLRLFVSDVRRLIYLVDPLEASLVGYKLVDIVDDYRETRGVVVGRGAEPWTCLQPGALHLDGLGYVEEAGLSADLTKICLPESLLHDDVKQSVHHTVVLHLSHRLA